MHEILIRPDRRDFVLFIPDKVKSHGNDIKKLSVVIPAYNEENTIASILDRIGQVYLINDIEKEIIIVNDCSKDSTEQKVRDFTTENPALNIRYFCHRS